MNLGSKAVIALSLSLLLALCSAGPPLRWLVPEDASQSTPPAQEVHTHVCAAPGDTLGLQTQPCQPHPGLQDAEQLPRKSPTWWESPRASLTFGYL